MESGAGYQIRWFDRQHRRMRGLPQPYRGWHTGHDERRQRGSDLLDQVRYANDPLINNNKQLNGVRQESYESASSSGFSTSDPRAAGIGKDVYRGSHDCRTCETGSAGRDHCCQPQSYKQSSRRGVPYRRRNGYAFTAVQKASYGNQCQHVKVIPAKDNQVVLSALTTGAVQVSRRIGVAVGSRRYG